MCVATALVAALLAGCDSQPETIADSDVPQIAGLENRHLSGLERDGETLVGARALYRGEILDPNSIVTPTIDRYLAHGWTIARRRVSNTSATLVFVKGDREAEVDLKTNHLNPAMGTGSIDLHRQGGAAARAAPAEAPAPPPAPASPSTPAASAPAGGTS